MTAKTLDRRTSIRTTSTTASDSLRSVHSYKAVLGDQSTLDIEIEYLSSTELSTAPISLPIAASFMTSSQQRSTDRHQRYVNGAFSNSPLSNNIQEEDEDGKEKEEGGCMSKEFEEQENDVQQLRSRVLDDHFAKTYLPSLDFSLPPLSPPTSNSPNRHIDFAPEQQQRSSIPREPNPHHQQTTLPPHQSRLFQHYHQHHGHDQAHAQQPQQPRQQQQSQQLQRHQGLDGSHLEQANAFKGHQQQNQQQYQQQHLHQHQHHLQNMPQHLQQHNPPRLPRPVPTQEQQPSPSEVLHLNPPPILSPPSPLPVPIPKRRESLSPAPRFSPPHLKQEQNQEQFQPTPMPAQTRPVIITSTRPSKVNYLTLSKTEVPESVGVYSYPTDATSNECSQSTYSTSSELSSRDDVADQRSPSPPQPHTPRRWSDQPGMNDQQRLETTPGGPLRRNGPRPPPLAARPKIKPKEDSENLIVSSEGPVMHYTPELETKETLKRERTRILQRTVVSGYRAIDYKDITDIQPMKRGGFGEIHTGEWSRLRVVLKRALVEHSEGVEQFDQEVKTSQFASLIGIRD
jgi:hypothetical protein